MSDTEKKLRRALERLEATTEKIIKTRGYNQDARSLKLLEEIIREQLINGNSRNPTRTIR
jgi:hypothetical protein